MNRNAIIGRIEHCAARRLQQRGLALSFLLLAVCGAGAGPLYAAAPDFDVACDKDGGLLLTLEGKPISKPEKPPQITVRFRPADAKVSSWGLHDSHWPARPEDGAVKETSFSAKDSRVTQRYAWGEVARTYRKTARGVDIVISVANQSDRTLFEFAQDVVTLTLPYGSHPPHVTEAIYFGQAAGATDMDTLSGPVALPLLLAPMQQCAYSYLWQPEQAPAGLVNPPVVVAATPETVKHLRLTWRSPTWIAPWLQKDPKAIADPGERKAYEESVARSKAGEEWVLRLSAGGDRLLFHERAASRPIPPGGRDEYVVSLRFGNDADPLEPARDLLQAYGKAHPMLFKWDDRRPIGMCMIGDSLPFHEPDGPELKRPAPGPRAAEVREFMLKSADDIIPQLKASNAQGVIFWNIEGQSWSGIKYVGDPRMIEYMCPEADAVADEFFKKFRDAGVKVGACIRPSYIMIKKTDPAGAGRPGAKEYEYYHGNAETKDGKSNRRPEDVLAEKVAYAKKRWGCTLFYVDTNYYPGFTRPETPEARQMWVKALNLKNEDELWLQYQNKMLDEKVWAEVLKRHPDVLFAIEHTPLIQYMVNAPFDGFDNALCGTPPVVKAAWPDAFKCMRTEGASFWPLVRHIQAGDVMLGQGDLIETVQAVVDIQKAGPPKELAGMGQEELLAAVADAKADRRLRFFAARKLCAGMPDPAALDQLLGAEDKLVPLFAIELLKTPDDVAAHVDRIAGLYRRGALFMGPVRDAMTRGGAQAVQAMARHIEKKPEDVGAGLEVLLLTPGPAAPEALAAIVKDAGKPFDVRQLAALHLGWRKDATEAQKDAALDFLLPFLGDPEKRYGIACGLSPRYVWGHGRFHRDPRVLEAVKAAADKERAKPSPETGGVSSAMLLGVFDKIIKCEQ